MISNIETLCMLVKMGGGEGRVFLNKKNSQTRFYKLQIIRYMYIPPFFFNLISLNMLMLNLLGLFCASESPPLPQCRFAKTFYMVYYHVNR